MAYVVAVNVIVTDVNVVAIGALSIVAVIVTVATVAATLLFDCIIIYHD